MMDSPLWSSRVSSCKITMIATSTNRCVGGGGGALHRGAGSALIEPQAVHEARFSNDQHDPDLTPD